MKNNKYILFIYGDCLRNMKNSHILKDSKYLGDSFIKGFGIIDIQNLPLAIVAKYPNNNAMINVEKYEVSENLITRTLDTYFNAPKYYTRKVVRDVSGSTGILYFGEEKTSKIKGKGTYVPNGDWRTYMLKKSSKEELKEKRRKRIKEYDDNIREEQEKKKNDGKVLPSKTIKGE